MHPWVQKYRPNTLDDIKSQENTVAAIKNFLRCKTLPHLVFYGPPGTGKTSLAHVIANTLYGVEAVSESLELNASDDRRIEIVRRTIQDFVSAKSFSTVGFKLVILDECDAMTKNAQFALRQIFEKYSKNVRFCIICNYAGKIIPALQSRCTRFRFTSGTSKHMADLMTTVAQKENICISVDARTTISRESYGDMRKMLNILQSVSLASKYITNDLISHCLATAKPETTHTVVSMLLNAPVMKCVRHGSSMARNENRCSISLSDIIKDLHPYVLRINTSRRGRINIIDSLAKIETTMTNGSTENLQLCALVGCFWDLQESV